MRRLINFFWGIVVVIASVSCSSRKAYSTDGKEGYGPNASYYYHHHHPAYYPDHIERSTYARNKIQISPRNNRGNY